MPLRGQGVKGTPAAHGGETVLEKPGLKAKGSVLASASWLSHVPSWPQSLGSLSKALVLAT